MEGCPAGSKCQSNRARNDDVCWAPKQPKIVTTNCNDLEEWISSMFSNSMENHKEAIRMRVAEVESIQHSLYANSSAPSGSQNFVEPRYNTEQVNAKLVRLLTKK